MTDESTELAGLESEQPLATTNANRMLMDPRSFEHAQRVANLFAKSQLVPKHLQDRPADCFLVLCIASEMGESPVMVAQNAVIIQGTAGWKAQWLIARANRTGALGGRIKYETERLGDPIRIERRIKDNSGQWKTVAAEVPNIAVTAYAKDHDGERVSYRVTMQMAIDEGWTQNPKYSSIGELMLSYRAASFLIRLNAPEVAMGYQTAEELEDMSAAGKIRDVNPPSGATEALRQLQPAAEGTDPAETVDSEQPDEGPTEAAQPEIVEPAPSADETEKTSETTPQEPQQDDTAATEPASSSVPLYDGSGHNLGGYLRQGSWLNALIKLVTEAQSDPSAAHGILHANAETIERIRAGGAYAEKLGQLDAMMQAIGEPGGDAETADWLAGHSSESGDHDLYAELTDDLESLVASQDTDRIRQRLNRADDIIDSSIRQDAQNELTEALQRAQP